MYQNGTNSRRGTYATDARQQNQNYAVKHDFDGPAKLSTTVVHAISGAANIDVSKVEKMVSQQIDLQALDRIFGPAKDASPRVHGHLSITVWGHDITIYGDGQIIISPQPNY